MAHFLEFWVLGTALATLRYAAPLALAALGGLFSERAGVVNIALEGLMLAGAFFAIYGSFAFGHWVFGLLLAMFAGAALSMLHAVASVNLHADQIISGTAIILLAAGLVNYLNLALFGSGGNPDVSRPPEFFGLSVLVVLVFVLLFATAFVIFRTPFGLRLRAVGEHPRAADTVGINVYRMRYIAVGMSGVLAGLAGAWVSFDVGNYSENMTDGRGFIALAALIFGKWTPFGAFAASLLFGFAQALGDRLQTVDTDNAVLQTLFSADLITMLPYLLTIIALAGFVGRATPPAAVGKPYTKG